VQQLTSWVLGLPIMAQPQGVTRLLLRLGSRALVQNTSQLSQSQWVASQWTQRLLPALQLGARNYSVPPHTIMTMPSLSPTMTQGNIVKWMKKEGEQIAPGNILAEVETDKATIEWEAQEEGYLAKILKGAGSKDIAVGTPVAVLVEEAGSVSAFKNFTGEGAPAATAAPAAAPAAPAPTAAAPAKPSGASFPPHQVLNMPSLSPTMSQGNILEWKKKVGDSVAPGDVYCEVETDKATISWESQEDGFVAQILLQGGSKDVPIGTPAIVLVEDKATLDAFKSFTAADAGAKPAAAAAPAAPTPAPAAAPKPAAAPAAPAAAPRPAAAPAAPGERVKASPYAKKLAAEAGVSLSGIAGTGPEGRVVAADVQQAVASGKAAPAGAAAAAPAATPGAAYVDIPHTQIRRITAQRLLESKTTVPHYYLSMEVAVDSMLAYREDANAARAKEAKISVNDFVVKAAALALKKVPGVNASWHGDFIRQYSGVDISVAVQTPIGLLTPIVKDAHTKRLSDISADVKTLAKKAKEGKLSPAEFMGGTFTISNLGMYGVKQFCAIINPPQAAILAVGGTDKKVVPTKEGGYKEVTTMIVTLSCDHRVVDGAMGAEWLQAFKGYIESPVTMFI